MPTEPFATPVELDHHEQIGLPPASHASLHQGLMLMREHFHRHLDAIEALARERAPRSTGDLAAREQQLQRRLAGLEQLQVRFEAESGRWERERKAMIEQLEQDRRLLSEAWERLEREQVKTAPVAAESGRSTAAGTPPAWALAVPTPGRQEQPVAEEILRQFQSLRRDVRRNAGESLSV
jgi:hypothetical protein